ncbi:MAG: undecaprenyl-diphosphate phosphatase [Promethearchaeota archaeon]|nr:MAG: undecaprenyl-diphosphate phosphatase [Candidatus Lokiarchaeota archaeon]
MIEFILIAILQGLFEWLPISSSGQVMIIAMNLFGIPPNKAFSLAIWLHLGTTIAVLLKFRTDFYKIAQSFFPFRFEINEIDIKNRNWLIIATIGTAITALPLYFIFKTILAESYTPMQGEIITLIIAGLLIITGIILLIVRKLYGSKSIDEISKKDLRRDSFIAGLMQGIAILPGISRSGITVSTILFEKYDQNNALKLSFLMAVPASIASILVDIFFGEGSVFGFLDPLTIIIITLISFITGYLTIEILLRIAKKVNFGYFCLIYGIIAYMIIIPFLIMS